MNCLTTQSLATLAAKGIATPAYSRPGLPGVVHLGLGAFHRAHQAMVFDTLLSGGDSRWGVLGVAMRSTTLADWLAAQDQLYSVQITDHRGVAWQVVGAIWQTCVAARDPERVMRGIAAASTRWITLTVTEKAYGVELAALLVRGLSARKAAGLGGLTIASCDNLSHNGDQLKTLCVNAASRVDPSLGEWISSTCRFPNSMVDRIVPAATPERRKMAADMLGVEDQAALGTEAFWEWVIEDNFVDPGDAQALASAGVTVVMDVVPFEEAKLRMLNASHSAMACMGAVAGLAVISDCISEPQIHRFIHDLMTLEVGPQQSRSDWPQYRDALLARFANPALQHSLHQIATDSSQKIPQRWPPSVAGAMQAGLPFERLAFAAASWMRYLRGVNEAGQTYAVNDPMAAQLQALASTHANDASATVQAIGTLKEIWGDDLPVNLPWLARVEHWLRLISGRGVLQALAQLNNPATAARQ